MKKLSLSLGAVLLSGLVLASCGANTSIKAPSKGKAVDSVTFNGTSGSVEIKKDDNYNDVVEHILDEGFTLELTDDDATESSYIGTREDIKSIKGKNYLTTTSDIAPSIPGGKQKLYLIRSFMKIYLLIAHLKLVQIIILKMKEKMEILILQYMQN